MYGYMNIILKKIRPVEYYIACVKKHSENSFVVHGKYITIAGEIRAQSRSSEFRAERQALDRCHSLAKTKIRKKNFEEIPLSGIPEIVSAHMEIPVELQITAQELLIQIEEARKERYVVFKKEQGLDDFFDSGVEYLGFVTEDDGIISVFDRYGDSRDCFVERMESIIPTEDAEKAKGLKNV